MTFKFVTGEPALLTGKALVIADLHLGAERDYRAAGMSMPSQTAAIEARITGLLRRTKARRLIILGDVKHRVPGISFQEEREVPAFINRLNRKASVEVVPGNHDGWLARLCPEVTIHPSGGVMLGDFWLCHGHAWPPAEALNAEAIVIGHNHPQVEFVDRLGKAWRERIWVRTNINHKPLRNRYKKLPKNVPELIIMPAFSPLIGGWAVNKAGDWKTQHRNTPEGMGPLTRSADIRHARAFLLDGTFLGGVSNI